MADLTAYIDKMFKKISPSKKNGAPALNGTDEMNREILDMPIREGSYVVFDTELTGLKIKKDSIVSIGAVRIRNGRIDLGDLFYRVVEPETKLTGQSIVIHGITPAEAAAAPNIGVLLPEFLDFCGDSIMVGHMVSIDIGFINKEMARLYGSRLKNPAVDTYSIYRRIRQAEERACAFHEGRSENADLFTLAKKYEIPVTDAHNALNDAFITAQLFQRFLSVLPKFGVSTVRELLKTGSPIRPVQ